MIKLNTRGFNSCGPGGRECVCLDGRSRGGRTVKPALCFFEGGSVPSLLPRRASLTVFGGFFVVFLLDAACVGLDAVGSTSNRTTVQCSLGQR